MSISYTYPGVYIQELPSPVHTIAAAATSIAAFVGYTSSGIDNRAQVILSFADFERLYGGLAPNSELSYAVQQCYQNGGSKAYVVRVPLHGAKPASVTFDELTFATLSSGSWANSELLIDVDVQNINLTSDSLAFNLTITDLLHQATESFPNVTLNSSAMNYVQTVVNDPDNGSQRVNVSVPSTVPVTAVAVTGIVGEAITPGAVATAVGGSATATTVLETAAAVLEADAITTANEIAGNPGAGTLITGQPLGAGTYAVTWTATLSGTVDAADFNNFGLYNGTDLIAAAENMTAAGTYPQPPLTVPIPAGGATLAVKNIAASTSGAVYAAQLTTIVLPILPTTKAAGGPFTNPDAEKSITSQPLGEGTYAVAWTATLYGTVDAGDLNNFGLYNGTDLIAAAVNMTAAGTYPQPPLTVPIPAGGATLAVKNIAASASGAVYAAQLTTTVWIPSYTGFGLDFSTSSPTPPVSPPPPVTVKVFGNGTPIPQSVGGLATQLQQAINAVLAVQIPGASVQCSVSQQVADPAWPPTNLAIRVNAMLPQQPDAVVTFASPSSGGLLDVSGALGLSSPTLPNVAHYALGTGNEYAPGIAGGETASTAGTDGTGELPYTADIIGDPAQFTGIYALQKVDLFNLLSIPDATRALPIGSATPDPNVNPVAIYSSAITLCDEPRRAFLLVDPPPYITTVTGAVDWKTSGLGITDPNGAAFWPRLRLPDPLNNYNLRTFAPSGVVAGVYATTDGSSGVWKAPAGIRATLNGVQSMTYQLSDLEQGLLNPLGLNCFRAFPVYGSVLWGARTLAGADALASQWKYVPVRRMALFLEQSLYQGTQWVVFEPNDEPLWAAIRLNIGSFMQTYFLKGAFQGQTPDQAYFVKCDSETTTQTDIDNGIVNILVGFAPLQPAEFVVIQIEQLTGQASS